MFIANTMINKQGDLCCSHLWPVPGFVMRISIHTLSPYVRIIPSLFSLYSNL